ncbi:hypothetical protein R6M67_43165 [Streptomyces sp. Wh19]|nr:hypothetical protein [Streptomyces sp. Wh19]
MELPCRRQVNRPLDVLRLLHRPLVFLGRCDREGVLQQPLLYRQKLHPPEPLCVQPPSEVLALDVVLDQSVAALPPGVPGRAPARIDRVQLIPPRLGHRPGRRRDGEADRT